MAQAESVLESSIVIEIDILVSCIFVGHWGRGTPASGQSTRFAQSSFSQSSLCCALPRLCRQAAAEKGRQASALLSLASENLALSNSRSKCPSMQTGMQYNCAPFLLYFLQGNVKHRIPTEALAAASTYRPSVMNSVHLALPSDERRQAR